ncbi:MAG TPA: hypothetical protein GX708_07840 [Gallicola sp.]|jgi:Leucine-rich repeat (LRR) protein|nr:hypothetical protein [Gallicola sp.]HQD92885.1 hypothetical protein [Bacilli bacterium]
MTNRDKVINIINPIVQRYLNYSVAKLKEVFDIKSKAKSINSLIISKLINLEGLDIESTLFLKKFAVFKTVNLSPNNKLVESMSFPSIDYYDMIKNEWHKSSVFKYFSTKTIVIFVFKKEENDARLIKVKYLNLSNDELKEISSVWEKVKYLVINDKLIIGGKHGFSVENFPKKENNYVAHIRPHDRNAMEGRVLLPNGKRIINYCFWLNNTFLQSKINEE